MTIKIEITCEGCKKRFAIFLDGNQNTRWERMGNKYASCPSCKFLNGLDAVKKELKTAWGEKKIEQ